MKTIDQTQWHNTGSNGKASEVWIRRIGNYSAEILVMPYRCLVTLYVGTDVDLDFDGIPFQSLNEAKHWAESILARFSSKQVTLA